MLKPQGSNDPHRRFTTCGKHVSQIWSGSKFPSSFVDKWVWLKIGSPISSSESLFSSLKCPNLDKFNWQLMPLALPDSQRKQLLPVSQPAEDVQIIRPWFIKAYNIGSTRFCSNFATPGSGQYDEFIAFIPCLPHKMLGCNNSAMERSVQTQGQVEVLGFFLAVRYLGIGARTHPPPWEVMAHTNCFPARSPSKTTQISMPRRSGWVEELQFQSLKSYVLRCAFVCLRITAKYNSAVVLHKGSICSWVAATFVCWRRLERCCK